MRKLFISLLVILITRTAVAQNVGIGTITPTTKLQVGDFSNAFNNYLTVKTAGGNLYRAGLGLYHFNDNYGWLLESDETNSSFSIRHRNGLLFNNPAFTIDGSERVGIGTLNPTSKLQVGDYSNANDTYLTIKTVGLNQFKAGLGLYHFNDNFGWLLESDETNSSFSIRHRNGLIFNNPALTIDQLERVGIGTVNPTTKLQVGDFSSAFDNYMTVKTAGGNLYKSGLGLYHFNENIGWLLESDETNNSFAIRHRNGLVFNNPVIAIGAYDNVGIGTINPTTKLQVGDYSNDNDTYLTIKTTGGNLHKSGLGLYHYNDNFGWLMESDETNSSFSIRHRNGLIFNNPAFTIDGAERVGIGTTDLNHKLTVDGNSKFTGNVGIGQDAYIYSRLTVNSATNLVGLWVQGNNATGAGIIAEGKTIFDVRQKQVVIDGTASGNSTLNNDSYPLLIQGAQQGIAIHVNSGSSNSGNNFLYFTDNNYVRGSVAGQTLSELYNSFDYIWFQTMSAIDAAFILAEGLSCAAQLDVFEVATMAAEGAVVIAKWAEATVNMENSVGVVYQSNAADYAEWLQRADSKEHLEPGMIVGVTGGRISKHTEEATQLMVISTAPLVLGNTPPEGRQAGFEKVAFMGQVPVRVRGSVDVGDYILASGQSDGVGRAVSPTKMRLTDYDKVVGVAWSSSEFQNGESLINTAVGLNTHDLIGEIKKQKTEVAQLKETLSGVLAYLNEKDPSFKLKMPEGLTAQKDEPAIAVAGPRSLVPGKKIDTPTDLAGLIAFLKKSPEFVDDMLLKAKEICASRGIDVNSERTKLLFDRNAFFQRLDKALALAVKPGKSVQPVKNESKLILPETN
jgi:myo-inositol-hexaphosphate 3-phosphohydrolase